MSEILENTLITEFIWLAGGGGNTDVCPGRQTPSRRHCGYVCSSDSKSQKAFNLAMASRQAALSGNASLIIATFSSTRFYFVSFRSIYLVLISWRWCVADSCCSFVNSQFL